MYALPSRKILRSTNGMKFSGKVHLKKWSLITLVTRAHDLCLLYWIKINSAPPKHKNCFTNHLHRSNEKVYWSTLQVYLIFKTRILRARSLTCWGKSWSHQSLTGLSNHKVAYTYTRIFLVQSGSRIFLSI